jgi:predicted nucleic acid-binding protein
MRIAFDTHVLLYAEGLDDPGKASAARHRMTQCADGVMHLPLQVVLEGTRVLRTKLRWPDAAVRATVDRWRVIAEVALPIAATLEDALTLSFRHRLQIFDAMILATAADARCELLLSEDFHDGFVWKGCTVANPFADKLHPLLKSLLGD